MNRAPSRPARRGRRIAAIACLALLLTTGATPLLLPAAAQGPPPPPLTEESIQGFVDIWMPRLASKTWIQDYLMLGPGYVVDDGYNGYEQESRGILAQRLAEAWEAANAAAYAQIHADPAPEAVAERRAELRGFLAEIVWDKRSLVQHALNAAGLDVGQSMPQEHGSIAAGDRDRKFPGFNETQIQKLYAFIDEFHERKLMTPREYGDQILERSAADVAAYGRDHPLMLDPHAPVDFREVDPLTLHPDAARSFQHGFQPRIVPVTPAVLNPHAVAAPEVPLRSLPARGPADLLADVGLPPLPGLDALPLPQIPTADLPTQLPPLDLPQLDLGVYLPDEVLGAADALLGQANGLLNATLAAATFDVCWQHRDAAEPTCKVAPALYNLPTPLDLDGDNLPEGLLTIAAPSTLGVAPDIAVAMTWKQLGTPLAPLPDLPYRLLARGAFAGTDRHAFLALDGRGEALPTAATLTLSVGPRQAVEGIGAGDATLRAAVAPGLGQLGVLGAIMDLEDAPGGETALRDPLLVAVHYAPVPTLASTTFGFETALRLLGPGAAPQLDAHLGLEADLQTTVALQVLHEATRGGVTSAQVGSLDLDALAGRADVTFRLTPAGAEPQQLRADLTTTLPSATATLQLMDAPDITDAATYQLARLVLRGVPIEVHASADFTPGVAADLATHVPYGALGHALVVFADVAGGDLRRAAVADLEAPSSRLDVGVTRHDGVLLDADAVASAPLAAGSVLLLDGAPAPAVPAGNHLLAAADGAGFALHATVGDFRELHLRQDTRDATRFDLTQEDAGPFALLLDANAGDDDRDRTLLVLSDTPDALDLDVLRTAEPPTLRIRTTGSAPVADASLQRTMTRPDETLDLAAALLPLPGRFTLEAAMAPGEPLRLEAQASARVAHIEMALARAAPGIAQDAVAVVDGFDQTLSLGLDDDAWTAFTNGGAVEHLVADMRVEDGALRALHADVTDLPQQLAASWGATLTTDPVVVEASPPVGAVSLGYAEGAEALLAPAVPGHYLGLVGAPGAAHLALLATTFHLARIDPTAGAQGDLMVELRTDDARPLDLLVQVPGATLAAQAGHAPSRLELTLAGPTLQVSTDGPVDALLVIAQQQAAARALAFVAEDLMGEMLLDTTTALPVLRAPAGIGRLRLGFADGGRPVAFIAGEQDGLVVHADAAGRTVALLASGIRRMSGALDYRHLQLDATQAGPFFVQFADGARTLEATLSRLPGNVTLDLDEPARVVTYAADEPIQQLTFRAVFAGHEMQLLGVGVPRVLHVRVNERFAEVNAEGQVQELRLGALMPQVNAGPVVGPVAMYTRLLGFDNAARFDWGQGFLDYKASGVGADVVAEFLDMGTGLATRVHAAQAPRHARITYDNARLTAVAEPDAAGLLEAWVRDAGPVAMRVDQGAAVPDYRELAGHHGMFQNLAGAVTDPLHPSTQFYASLRVAQLRFLQLDGSGTRIHARLAADAAQTWNGYFLDRTGTATERMESFLSVEGLPRTLEVTMDPVAAFTDYASSSPAERVEVSVRPLGAAEDYGRVLLEDTPTQGRLTWVDEPPTVAFDGRGTTGALELELYLDAPTGSNETGFLARAMAIPSHVDFSLIGSRLAFNGSLPTEPGIGDMNAYIKVAPPLCAQPRELGPRANPDCLEAFHRLETAPETETGQAEAPPETGGQRAEPPMAAPAADGPYHVATVALPPQTPRLQAAEAAPADSHSMVSTSPEGTIDASFEYAGFKSFQVETEGPVVRIIFDNDRPQRFQTSYVDREGEVSPIPVEAYIDINAIPADFTVEFDFDAEEVRYTGSDPIDYVLLTGSLLIPDFTLSGTVILEDLPTQATLHVWSDSTNGIDEEAQALVRTDVSGASWDASGNIGRIYVEVNLGPLGLLGELKDIGSHLRFEKTEKYKLAELGGGDEGGEEEGGEEGFPEGGFGEGEEGGEGGGQEDRNAPYYTLTTVDAPIGEAFVAFKLGGDSFRSLEGDHIMLTAGFDGLFASVRLTGFKSLVYETNTDEELTHFEMDLEGGQMVNVLIQLDADVARALIRGVLGPMPKHVQYHSEGGVIDYEGENFDLELYMEIGPTATLPDMPDPPKVHGLSIYVSLEHAAIKANLWLTGLPEKVHLDPDAHNFAYEGFRPQGAHTEEVPNPQRAEAEELVQEMVQYIRDNPVDFFLGGGGLGGLFGGGDGGLPEFTDEDLRRMAIDFLMDGCILLQSPDDMPETVTRSVDGLPLVVLLKETLTGVQFLIRLENPPEDLNATIGSPTSEEGMGYEASSSFGPFLMQFSIPTGSQGAIILEAGMETLPQSMNLKVEQGSPMKVKVTSTGEQLDGVVVGLKIPRYSPDYIAAVELNTVPNNMELTIDTDLDLMGLLEGETETIVTYEADAPTLSIAAYIKADLAGVAQAIASDSSPGVGEVIGDIGSMVNLRVDIRAEVTGLGSTTTLGVKLDGVLPTVVFRSSPQTCRILVRITVILEVDPPRLGLDFDVGGIEAGIGVDLKAKLGIENFEIRLEHMKSMDLAITLPALKITNFDGYLRVGWDFVGLELDLTFDIYAGGFGVTLFEYEKTVTLRLTLELNFMTFIANESKGAPSFFYKCVDIDIGIDTLHNCLRIEATPRHVATTRNFFVVDGFSDVRPGKGDDPNAARYVAAYPHSFLDDWFSDYFSVDEIQEALIKIIVVLANGRFTEIDCC